MSRITKLELQQQLARLAEENRALREQLSALKMDLEIARKPKASVLVQRPEPAAFTDYFAYVAACRAHARAARLNVVTYQSREQFHAAQH